MVLPIPIYPEGGTMIPTILAVIGIGTLLYVLGNQPEAIEMEDRMNKLRDQHLHKMYKYGMRI
jgi:hypothetical protein